MSYTAEELMNVPTDEPERLVRGGQQSALKEYRALLAEWHPDRRPSRDGTEVFVHLSQLYRQAQDKLKNGQWIEPKTIVLNSVGDKTFRIWFKQRRKFELGEMFIGRSVLTFTVREEYRDLCTSALNFLEAFPYADDGMRAEFARCLPTIQKTFEAQDGSQVVVLRKRPDQFLLADVLARTKTTSDPRHVGWILNALLNLACYLDWAGINHNAIGPDTVFISPSRHAISLLGGWWYACREGAVMKALPARSAETVPKHILNEKRSSRHTDLETIRLIGRELLTNRQKTGFAMATGVPDPLKRWLQLPTSGHPATDYSSWTHVLKETFGQPKFVPFEINETEIYGS